MKIAVVTSYDNNFLGVANVVMPRWRNYCKKQGYTFIEKVNCGSGRHPVWDKVYFTHQILPNYDYVLYLDADTLLTNPDIKIEDFIALHPDKDLLISDDCHGLNVGVFIIKNTKWSLDYLEQVWNIERWINGILGEQIAMREILGYNSTNVVYVEQKLFNAYKYEIYDKVFPSGQWNEKSFLLHLPGYPNDKRVTLFTKVLNNLN